VAPAQQTDQTKVTPGAGKLSFKEARELAELPGRIEMLENTQSGLHQRLSDPAFYQASGDEVATVRAHLQDLESELEAAYARWEALEARRGASA